MLKGRPIFLHPGKKPGRRCSLSCQRRSGRKPLQCLPVWRPSTGNTRCLHYGYCQCGSAQVIAAHKPWSRQEGCTMRACGYMQLLAKSAHRNLVKCILPHCTHALCRAELQQTGEELLSALSLANGALEYIPPVIIDGITVKSATAKTKGEWYVCAILYIEIHHLADPSTLLCSLCQRSPHGIVHDSQMCLHTAGPLLGPRRYDIVQKSCTLAIFIMTLESQQRPCSMKARVGPGILQGGRLYVLAACLTAMVWCPCSFL